jgi:flagellar basal body-associated protein FliL
MEKDKKTPNSEKRNINIIVSIFVVVVLLLGIGAIIYNVIESG